MIPRRVQLALLIAFLCHGFFILTGRYRLSYDAYTHMLFANHYAESWFSLWETRWYTGFTVVSYPPLIHQLTALLIPILGFDAAFALILWMVTTLCPLGIYAFSRIFTGKAAAAYAALASAILLPIYVVAHIFGQLPFLASTLIALFGAASLDRYLREGGIYNLLLTISVTATTMSAHHATLLVQPFLMIAVIAFQINKDNWRTLIFRFGFFGVLAAIASIIVIWPFWQWGMHQTIQTPIDHLSRHNFITDLFAQAIFFWPMYGPLVIIIPVLFRKWPLRFVGLVTSFTILFLLGLGGTTPLPRLFFGDAWEWLTYDRFSFWACLTLTPFFAMIFIQLKRKWRNRFVPKPILGTLQKNIFSVVTFSVFALTTLGAWLTPLLFPIQPEPIKMQPIVDFLKRADRSQWRYLTFGFGDQFAYLNLLTKATTIDGSYHTARTLRELRKSGIGQVDTVYWALKGIPAIVPILQESGEHGVRWGFVNPDILKAIPLRWGTIHRNEFVSILEKLGWMKLKTLKNGILVYENPKATPPEPTQPESENPITSFSWGVFPILALVTTSTLGALRIWPIQAEQAIRGVHAFIVGLIPVSFCFWYYGTIAEFPHDRVYFIYDSALFFLSDAFTLLAVLLWLSVKIANASHLANGQARNPLLHWQFFSTRENVSLRPTSGISFTMLTKHFVFPLFILFLLSSLSVLWSIDGRVSLYISLHLLLAILLALSISDWREAWRPAMLGLCAASSLQIITGMVEFASQSTVFLNPLHMTWPGPLDPFMRGASVVHLSNGSYVLRAYGTLPHPNILGGFTLLSLLGPAYLFLTNKKLNHPSLILFALGTTLLALTFSRSAWLGLMVLSLILILKSKYLDRKRLSLLLSTAVLSFAITVLPYLQLVQARTVNITSDSEKFSFTGRIWLNQEALQMIRQHAFTGTGIGSFIIGLSQRAGPGYIIEPVHNILLLAATELGFGGLILVMILTIALAYQVLKTQNQNSILAGATITGLGIICLFDHYFWTLAPCRLMLALAFGLWAGQTSNNDM